jgi:hypothetical protein
LISLSLAGCGVISGPVGYDLPPEDFSLDPSRLRVGAEIYYCGDWNRVAGRPNAPSVFADVFFFPGLEQARLDHPLEVHRYIVEQVGAKVVRSFHAPGFRVWITTDSIPSLYAHGGIAIRAVPDPSRYDLQVIVFYGGAGVFGGSDSMHVTTLGGRVIRNFENLGLVTLQIPDRSLAQIRSDARVQWIEPGPDFLCPH